MAKVERRGKPDREEFDRLIGEVRDGRAITRSHPSPTEGSRVPITRPAANLDSQSLGSSS